MVVPLRCRSGQIEAVKVMTVLSELFSALSSGLFASFL